MAVVDADAVPGTDSARRRLRRIGVRLALTAGFAVAGWLLCGLAAPAASASELPQTPAAVSSPSDSTNSADSSGGGLLGGLLGNTVNSLGSTVNSLLGTVNTTLNSTLDTVGSTVNSVVNTVGTTVVTPAVTTVSQTVTPVVAPLVSKQAADTPAADPTTTTTSAPAISLPAQPSPTTALAPVVNQTHHGATIPAPTKATRLVEQLRPDSAPLPLPKAPQPAPQQPVAPAPTISTGHGPNGGNRHAVHAVTASATGGLSTLLTTVASHPIVVPGDMPGLPSVSPD